MNQKTANRIKNEDRRAFGKFIIIIMIALLIGGILGFIAMTIRGGTGDRISTGLIGFLSFFSPYAIIIATVVITITNCILYRKSRRIYKQWDGENEDELDRMEALLGNALWFSSLNMITTYFFFAAGIILNKFTDPYNLLQIIRFLLLFCGMVISLVVITLTQQRIINFEKEINPEKKGSIFDMRFSKKWEESCDEAQKLIIYKAAYKAYQAANMTCIILWVFCIVGSFIWDLGIMPVTMVIIIWTVQVSGYHLEVKHLNKNHLK